MSELKDNEVSPMMKDYIKEVHTKGNKQAETKLYSEVSPEMKDLIEDRQEKIK